MILTQEQLAIVHHRKGSALVLAGAGTGKTTTLVEYAISLTAKEKNVLLLTFSTTACEELDSRLRQRFEQADLDMKEYGERIMVKTYDAFGYDLVRRHYKKLDFDKPPTLIENTELFQQCVAKVAKPEGFDKKILMKDAVEAKKRIVSGASKLKSFRKMPLLKAVFKRYEALKKVHNVVDFEDMIGLILRMDMKRELKAAARKFDYLLVDELQDTSVSQTKMLIALANHIGASVMVGDPKQNINGFRGAYQKNWEAIKEKLKPMEYSLTHTQRLRTESLGFINAIGNEIYPGAELKGVHSGGRIRIVKCHTIPEQALFIANEIKYLIENKGVRPDQIACLGRTQRLLSDLSIALAGHNVTTHEIYRQPEDSHVKGIKYLLLLSRWLRRQPIDQGFEFPPKARAFLEKWLGQMGATDEEIEKIFDEMPEIGWKALRITSRIKGKGKGKGKAKAKANPKYRGVLKFREMITEAAQADELEKAMAYLIVALRKVLSQGRKQRDVNFLIRDLSVLKTKVRQFQSWEELDVQKLRLRKTKGCVQLSTMNGAKGKEWEYVFVLHCVDGIMPIHHANTPKKLDSEKRLFYVAVTRHKEGLYLMDCPGSMVSYSLGKRRDIGHAECSSFITPHKKKLTSLEAV